MKKQVALAIGSIVMTYVVTDYIILPDFPGAEFKQANSSALIVIRQAILDHRIRYPPSRSNPPPSSAPFDILLSY